MPLSLKVVLLFLLLGRPLGIVGAYLYASGTDASRPSSKDILLAEDDDDIADLLSLHLRDVCTCATSALARRLHLRDEGHRVDRPNAIHYIPEDGTVTVRLTPDDETVRVEKSRDRNRGRTI